MAEAYYIRVPLDDLEQPHWRCLLAETGGADAIVLALRLRGLAAKCNCGGLITTHTGRPMTPDQIATHMGYTPQQIKRCLELLHQQDMVLAVNDDKGGIRVVDPVLDAHLSRIAPHALPSTTTKNPNQRYSRPLTQAERQRLHRTGQLPQDVRRLDMSRHVSRPAVTENVTTLMQHTDSPCEIGCHVTDSTSSSTSSSNKEDVTPAAVPSAADHNPIPAEISEAIDLLPATARPDCLVVAANSNRPAGIIASNIRLLADRLKSAKSKSIASPTGWLINALDHDLAAPQRQAQTQAKAAKEKTTQRSQVEQERQERERYAELQRQAQLLRAMQELDPAARAAVEADAVERMHRIGAESDQVRLACLVAATESHITGGDAT